MTTVLFTHHYSMEQVRWLCSQGEYPRHHLWGADALEQSGFAVRYGYFGARRRGLAHLSWRLGGVLGDLEQEVAMLRAADADTVIYAPEAGLVRGLAPLRRAGWRVPIAAVVHAAPAPGRVRSGWVAGLDVALCLSADVRDRLVEGHGRDPAATPVVSWGPDLDFPGYVATGDELVVSAGKTERDVETLVAALRRLGERGRVYASGSQPPGGDGVEIVDARASRDRPPPDYATALADLRRASVVAIPLRRTDRLFGLSEVNDALALAKPIVMTRTDALGFDPGAVGCGFSVEAGDVDGWCEALGSLAGDGELRARMGRRGREFAERGHNAERFRAGVVSALRGVVADA